MTMMKSADGSQYVLVLTKEQAELLGTLRFSHVAGGAALYAVLEGLPHKPGANFQRTYDPATGKPIFGALVPAPKTPEPRIVDSIIALDFGGLERRVLAAPGMSHYMQMAGLMKDEATLRKERKVGWIVQYQVGYTGGVWTSLVGNGSEANLVYSSRNEAYRQMRKRAAKLGVRLDRYRVVPNDTKDGPESDRGYYVVEYCHKLFGWDRSGLPDLCGKFPSADAARRAINTRTNIALRSRYRVKWHPNRT